MESRDVKYALNQPDSRFRSTLERAFPQVVWLDPLSGLYPPGLRVHIFRDTGQVCFWRLRVRQNLAIHGRHPARPDCPFEAGYLMSEGRCGYSSDGVFEFLVPGEYVLDLSLTATFSFVVYSSTYTVLSLCFCCVPLP